MLPAWGWEVGSMGSGIVFSYLSNHQICSCIAPETREDPAFSGWCGLRLQEEINLNQRGS